MFVEIGGMTGVASELVEEAATGVASGRGTGRHASGQKLRQRLAVSQGLQDRPRVVALSQ